MPQAHRSAEFCFSGKFLGYVFKEGYKIKRLMLATADGEISIKVTKLARATLKQTLLPGDWIQVGGTQKFDRKTNSRKFKAAWIRPSVSEAIFDAPKPSAKPGGHQILMCQKPGCMKRGGAAMCRAIDTALEARGISEQVTVKGTGCMKACGKVPMVFPGKNRYTKVDPDDVAALIDEHFAGVTAPKVEQPSMSPCAEGIELVRV